LSGIWVCATTTGCWWVTADMNCGIDPSQAFAPRAHLPSIANPVNVPVNASPSPPAASATSASTSASVVVVVGRCASVQATHAVTRASGSNAVNTQRMVFSEGGRTAPSNGSTQAPNRSNWARVRAAAHCAAASSDSNPGTMNAENVTASTYPNGWRRHRLRRGSGSPFSSANRSRVSGAAATAGTGEDTDTGTTPDDQMDSTPLIICGVVPVSNHHTENGQPTINHPYRTNRHIGSLRRGHGSEAAGVLISNCSAPHVESSGDSTTGDHRPSGGNRGLMTCKNMPWERSCS
jgi:hypothetical protein